MSEHQELNGDYAQRVVMHSADMDWQSSPGAKVWRKRLHLVGPPEAGRVTSIVRYDPGSTFPPHEHPDGEEILVLEGTFCDEHGAYPVGTYLLNPEGFAHAPYSEEGCVLFVKLRQYPGQTRGHVVVKTREAAWEATEDAGRERMPLYSDPAHPEKMHLTRLAPGAAASHHAHPGGEEVLVIEGSLEDEFGRYGKGDWLRYPDGSAHRPRTDEGCLLYVKVGHLGALEAKS
jgi:anti-sigma factor ChrR (cupin superfamily)